MGLHTIVISIFVLYVVCFFVCKQKTAYEMRISDWSSDVCSSDLVAGQLPPRPRRLRALARRRAGRAGRRGPGWAVRIPRLAYPARLVAAQQCPPAVGAAGSSEERRVGQECVSTCRSRWTTYH